MNPILCVRAPLKVLYFTTYINIVTTPDIKIDVTRVEVIVETKSPKICKSAFVITNMI